MLEFPRAWMVSNHCWSVVMSRMLSCDNQTISSPEVQSKELDLM